jgi:hypothetical protein
VLARVDLVSAWLKEQTAGAPADPPQDPPQDPPNGFTCSHGLCVEGPALEASCNGCVAYVCGFDPYCCETAWDKICIDEALQGCTNTCG